MKRTFPIIIIFFYFGLLTGCKQQQIKKYFNKVSKGEVIVQGVKVNYPLDNTIFPPEFQSPNFEWTDTLSNATSWYIFVSDSVGKILLNKKSEETIWQPDSSDWEKLKLNSHQNNLYFTVISESSKEKTFSTGRMKFSFSKDSVGADIFFRAVTLPFSYAVKNVHTIEWYMGDVKGNKPRKMLDNIPVCANCHTFSKDQKLLAMDIDYGNDKGSYSITTAKDTSYLKSENIISWNEYKPDPKNPTFGLLSQISPNGNYVLSTVKDLSVFVAVDDNLAFSQLFFPIKGIIGMYNRETKNFGELNGANDPNYVQSNPTWSPDGKKVLFARNQAYVSDKVKNAGRALLHVDDIQEFAKGEKPFKYDLYSVDFNNGNGGNSIPLKGASGNGKSNYFPRYSPDGKWIVFCQADNFMLLQKDSKLYIMPAEGGTPRLMNCNLGLMNSWHSWSPNSRWLVFSSKNKGIYTQLYLTHIDENGIDSPPILLENLLFEKRAANIPEFFPHDSKEFICLKDAFSKTAPYLTQLAINNIDYKYFKRASEAIDQSIEVDSTYLQAYFQRITLNVLLNQTNSKTDRSDKKKALSMLKNLISKDPGNEELLLYYASLLSNMDRNDEAFVEANKLLIKNPSNYQAYELMSSICRKTKKYDKILPYYDKMLSIMPSNYVKIKTLTVAFYRETGQNIIALNILNSLINKYPDVLNFYSLRADIYLDMNEYTKAKSDLDYIVNVDENNIGVFHLLYRYYTKLNDKTNTYKSINNTLRLIDNELKENNENIELLFEEANIFYNMNNWEDAEVVYDKILKMFPINYTSLKQKARIELLKKNWNEAITLYNILIDNYTPEEELFNNKAIALVNLGKLEDALNQFNSVIKLNPENYDARYNKARLLKMMGNMEQSNAEKQNIKAELMLKQKKRNLTRSEKELLKLL